MIWRWLHAARAAWHRRVLCRLLMHDGTVTVPVDALGVVQPPPYTFRCRWCGYEDQSHTRPPWAPQREP